jgi:hypothetical protein
VIQKRVAEAEARRAKIKDLVAHGKPAGPRALSREGR